VYYKNEIQSFSVIKNGIKFIIRTSIITVCSIFHVIIRRIVVLVIATNAVYYTQLGINGVFQVLALLNNITKPGF